MLKTIIAFSFFAFLESVYNNIDEFKDFLKANNISFDTPSEFDFRYKQYSEIYEKIYGKPLISKTDAKGNLIVGAAMDVAAKSNLTGLWSKLQRGLRMTKFSILTREEVQNYYLIEKDLCSHPETPGELPRRRLALSPQMLSREEIAFSKVPRKINWFELGHVRPVVDQGNCSACYAAAVAAAIEAGVSISFNQTLRLSIQELLECNPLTTGCKGGHPFHAYMYVLKAGVHTEDVYPTTWKNNTKCRIQIPESLRTPRILYAQSVNGIGSNPKNANRIDSRLLSHIEKGFPPSLKFLKPSERILGQQISKSSFSFSSLLNRFKNAKKPTTPPRFMGLTGYKPIRGGMRALIIAIARKPTVVLYHASPMYMQMGAGVFMGADCKPDDPLNHAGLAVGYNLDADPPYLILQNTWGSETWGDKGFVWMHIPSMAPGAAGICRIASSGADSYPGFRKNTQKRKI